MTTPTDDEILFGGAAGAGKSSARRDFQQRAALIRPFVAPDKLVEFDKKIEDALKAFDEYFSPQDE